MQTLNIKDVSALSRYGVKGPQASKWLTDHGIRLPTAANTWILSEQAMVMRLGASELLIEDQAGGIVCAKLEADVARVSGVYKVPRADAAYLLAGSQVLNLLSELCALDLTDKALADNGVMMTQVAGISAIVLRQTIQNETVYKLWCDGTYGEYMLHTLTEIDHELNSGAM